MPYWSAFTPYGALDYSGQPSLVEQIFFALAKAYGLDYSVQDNTHLGAKIYATARTLASAALTVERGANQKDPLNSREMLTALERQYRVTPSPGELVDDRRRFLAAKYLASRGSTPNNVLLALSTLLGSDLIAIVYPTETPLENGPPDPTTGYGVFARDDVLMNRFTFRFSVSRMLTGTPLSVQFQYVPDQTGERLKVGDVVAAQYENAALAERITITYAREGTPFDKDPKAPVARATFSKAKEAGASIWTGPRPFWNGTGRYTLVVGTAAAARDPETRRKVDEIMTLLMTGVSTWAFVEQTSSSPRETGPFTLGSSFLGSNTLEIVSF